MSNELELEGPPLATRSRRGLRSVPVAGPKPDPASFDAMYRSEWSAIVALGWSLTGTWQTAEELAQDGFADAYRRWDEVGKLDKPGAWVRRAVINRTASFHRHRTVEHQGLGNLSSRDRVDADSAGTDRTGDRATSRVGDPAFWAAVRSLPERQMAAVALHYLEDRPVAEIATILDCSAATVKVHLHRGRLSLAARLTASNDTSTTTRNTTDNQPLDNRGEEAR